MLPSPFWAMQSENLHSRGIGPISACRSDTEDAQKMRLCGGTPRVFYRGWQSFRWSAGLRFTAKTFFCSEEFWNILEAPTDE